MASKRSHWERLVQHGFINPKVRYLYTYDERKKIYLYQGDFEKDGKPHKGHAYEEETEEVNIALTPQLVRTGFPKPYKRYKLIYESFNANMEETYFWFLNHFRQDQAFPEAIKISDIFSASENSAFFGQSAQRLSIQEDRTSSFLRTIAEMVKALFQIIRELRIIDERLDAYEDWERTDANGNKRRSKSADSTLKGIFADFAENKGGQTQPGSIYHLAQTVGYASLPDLFFNTHVYRKEDVDKVIDGMKQFNPNVKSVLKRKLYQFLVWKERTHEELKNRKRFQIRYLRQHWATIKMYMTWTKPYLKHIQRLHMNEEQLDSPDLVSAFETSMTEVEVLFKKPGKGYHQCVLASYQFKTRPLMQYRQDYQQGPVHVGPHHRHAQVVRLVGRGHRELP
jgi:thioredoxin-related protein